MKHCPQCKKNYFETDLNYCLEDGERLVGEAERDEPRTVMLPNGNSGIETHTTDSRGGASTKQLIQASEGTLVLPVGFKKKNLRSRLLIPGGMILAMLAGGLGAWFFRTSDSNVPLRKLELQLRGADSGRHRGYSISPNGRMIAYVDSDKLWIRDLEKSEAREVMNSSGADFPFWSPDSSQVGYVVDKKIFRVASSGTGSIEVAELPGVMSGAGGASWGSDDSIVIATGDRGLIKVSSQGGVPAPILDVGPEESDFHHANYLPAGRGVLFTVHRGAAGSDTIAVLDGKTRKDILQVPGAWIQQPVYSATGHILFNRSNVSPTGIWAVPFSLDRLEVTGEPFLVASNGRLPSISDDGTLVYSFPPSNILSRLVWVDRSGNAVGRIQTEDFPNQWPATRLSPDGKYIALSVDMGGGTSLDTWVIDVLRGTRTQITFENDTNGSWFCGWTPDGKNVMYLAGSTLETQKVMMRPLDGSGTATPVVDGRDASFSPDGKYVIYTAAPKGYLSSDIMFKEMTNGAPPKPFLATQNAEMSPEFAPDGKYVAYVSTESGREEVFVRTFPDDGRKWQISNQGGSIPRWSRRGDELFFYGGNNIMVAPIRSSPKTEFGEPQKLFPFQPIKMERISGNFESYDVSPDGKRFALLERAPNQSSGFTLAIVQNWYAEFKGK